jgi:hypothetical protein
MEILESLTQQHGLPIQISGRDVTEDAFRQADKEVCVRDGNEE